MPRLSKWPLYRTFPVRHKGGLSYVTVAQATETETYMRSALLNPEGGDKWSPKFGRQEAYLVLASICNMEMPALDGSHEMEEPFTNGEGNSGTRIRYAMKPREFNDAWGEMYEGISEQIRDCVREMNPHWYNYDVLKAHLETITASFYEWNQFQIENKNTRKEDLKIRRDLGEVFPELPEVFNDMQRVKELGFRLPNPGGLLDQPEIYIMEIATALGLLDEQQHLSMLETKANASIRVHQGKLSQ
jgi:hypothetical protein